jgi:hypothetical protein
MDGSVEDGRFYYHNYPGAPQAYETETLACPQDQINRSVSQYGADYIALGCSAGQYNLHFEGATATGLLPADAYSGKMSFWSNKGDESDMILTREFDFTDVSGPIEMTYQTWLTSRRITIMPTCSPPLMARPGKSSTRPPAPRRIRPGTPTAVATTP